MGVAVGVAVGVGVAMGVAVALGLAAGVAMGVVARVGVILRTSKVSNEEVLRRVNQRREFLHTIEIRKVAYLGHVLRHERYELLQLIMMGKVAGRRGVDRRKSPGFETSESGLESRVQQSYFEI
ncbi:jg8019 [Pararge aegeria aegeria]|uniref:Jg8019 protein n=1 Tax=Pararge aegeria aegeria TaxID=348720 RepID=A0A8S4RKN5_9NEOP|nr:jg8019 [Pararge aegeria aegeria]